MEIDTLIKTPIYDIWMKELQEVKEAYGVYKTELEEIYKKDLESLAGNTKIKTKGKK